MGHKHTSPNLDATARKTLESARHAANLILEWTRDINEHGLWADKQKRAAVERQYEVIGEALKRLNELDPHLFGIICDAGTAVRLGEAIRRDYDAIDYGILWRGTRHELPEMLRTVNDLLARSN